MFERLALDFGATKPDQNGWEKVLKGIDAKKLERLKHLLHRLSEFMHLGRHEQKEAEHVGLDHNDGEYALILTQATLAYLARLWAARAPSGGSQETSAASVSAKKGFARALKPKKPSNSIGS